MNNKMIDNKRESYIDIAKGIGIILVILGHIDIGPATSWVYSFDLPLFYILSGLCFKYRESVLEHIKSKMRRCIIPYAVFGTIIVLVESKTGYLYETGLRTNLKRLLLQERYSTLWFLATWFFGNIIFYFIVKLCKQRIYLVLLVSIILSVIFVYLDQNVIRALPWNIDTAFIITIFMAVGYWLRENQKICNGITHAGTKNKIILATCFLIGNALCYIGNIILSGKSLEMYWNSYGIYPLMLAAAIFGSLFVIVISSSLRCAPLEKLGRNSMTTFALHQSVFLWPYTLLFRKIGLITFKPGINNIIAKMLLFILVIISCWIVDSVIRKTKLRVLLG